MGRRVPFDRLRRVRGGGRRVVFVRPAASSPRVEGVLTRGAAEGSMVLKESAAVEAEIFVAAVYGAMLAARAFDGPTRFSVVIEAAIRRISCSDQH